MLRHFQLIISTGSIQSSLLGLPNFLQIVQKRHSNINPAAIAVVSKLIKTSPCEVTGLCQDLCRAASAHTSSLEFLTGDGWITFVKSVLKFCMKSAGTDEPNLVGVKSATLETLSTLARRVYEGGNRPAESKMMYEMVCGHSNFVPLLFSGKWGEGVKARVLALVLALMKANPGDILSEVHQLPLFLGAYKGTLSASDRAILSIIYLNEKHKPGRLGSYAPMLWGQSAISKYSSGRCKTQALQAPFLCALFFGQKGKCSPFLELTPPL